jgi:predicted O-methyltransferase YrrM
VSTTGGKVSSTVNCQLSTTKLAAAQGPGRLTGADAKQSTIDKLQHALEAAGVEFIEENRGGPGVRLRKRQRRQD